MRWLALLAALCALSACGSPADPSDRGESNAVQIDVPDPDTTESEPRVRRAIAEARSRVLQQPDSAQAWGRLANVLFPHDMFDEALVAYRNAQRLEPDRFEWIYMMGATLELRGMGTDEAMKWFDLALTLRPQDPAIYIRLGEGHARRGRVEDAAASFRRAAQLAPNDPFPLRRLGETLLLAGEPEQAREALLRCRQLAPQAREPAVTLMQVLTQLDDDDEADRVEASLETLTDGTLNPRDDTLAHVMAHGLSTVLLFPRAVELANAQRYEDALRLFRICEEVHPESPRLNAWIGSCLLGLGDRAAARVHLERALRSFATEYRALITLAQIDMFEGRTERSRELLERARDAVPENAPAYAYLAVLAGRSGDHAEAIRLYRLAEDRAPLSARDLYNLAEAHLALREVPDAGRRLEQSIRRDPSFVQPRLRLGELLEAMGRRTEARRQYAEVIRIDPGNKRALERFQALPSE